MIFFDIIPMFPAILGRRPVKFLPKLPVEVFQVVVTDDLADLPDFQSAFPQQAAGKLQAVFHQKFRKVTPGIVLYHSAEIRCTVIEVCRRMFQRGIRIMSGI